MLKYINVKNIARAHKKDLNKLILDNESRYRGQLFTLANKILAKNNVKIVLLSGPSCAGKTTTAKLKRYKITKPCISARLITLSYFLNWQVYFRLGLFLTMTN